MKPQPAFEKLAWPDDRLVRECCQGNQAAWASLIEKYKNLIFSVPIKFGVPHHDAADIFQAVCLDLLTGLPALREPKALPKWLIQTTFHRCLRWKRERLSPLDDLQAEPLSHSEMPEEMIYQLEREQSVRDAIGALAPRCERMIRMLFFEDPPRAYERVAREVGVATGSVGFIRGRCLKQLRLALEKKGFK